MSKHWEEQCRNKAKIKVKITKNEVKKKKKVQNQA